MSRKGPPRLTISEERSREGGGRWGRNLGFYSADFSRVWHVVWPLAIILLGWSLLRGVTAPGGTHWAVTIELKNKGWKLESGAYTAFVGGVDLDLTAADILDGEIVLNLTAVMGGVEVKVPRDLTGLSV